MRPALYYPWVYLKGGAERTMLELMTRSRHDWTLFTNRYEPDATFPGFRDQDLRVLREISVRRSVLDVGRAGLTLLTQRLPPDGQDCLLVVSEGLGNLVALRSPLPTSCICLTPLKVAYDPFTRRQFFAGRRRLPQLLAVKAYTWLERPAWRRYIRVFCNSGETMKRIRDAGLVDEDRLEVAYHGVDLDRFSPAGASELFFLAPGRIMWSKNLELTINAWLRFKPTAADNQFRLVVAGMVDRKSGPYLEILRSLAAGREDIVFEVCPSDDRLVDLYRRCHAVVFSAFNEDLGLVPIEGMACGKPVLATDRGGPRETIVDGETGFLRPDDPDAFAAAMAVLASMPTADLRCIASRARARAERFGWDAFVNRIDRHVEEISSPVAVPA